MSVNENDITNNDTIFARLTYNLLSKDSLPSITIDATDNSAWQIVATLSIDAAQILVEQILTITSVEVLKSGNTYTQVTDLNYQWFSLSKEHKNVLGTPYDELNANTYTNAATTNSFEFTMDHKDGYIGGGNQCY